MAELEMYTNPASSFSFLFQKLSTVDGVYRNNHRHFGPYYDDTRPLAPVAQRINPYELNVRSSVDQILFRNGTTDFFYLSREVEPLGLDRDLRPLGPLLAPNPARSSVNLWLGPAGAVAHAHYDGYHNAFVQLQGRKRFLLLPPSAWQDLGLYPFVHPHHAQAAANLSQIWPELVTVEGVPAPAAPDTADQLRRRLQPLLLVADVEPGDVLYLPPLWFHHVIAVSAQTEGARTTFA